MKKISVLIFLVICLNRSVFGQENDRILTFQTNPTLFLINIFNWGFSPESTFLMMDLEGQYKINSVFNVSLSVSFFVNNYTLTVYTQSYFYGSYEETYRENNFQITIKPMLIYRPFSTGLKGFFIGLYPNIGWQTLESEYKDRDYFFTEIGIGSSIGYKWIFKNGITLQLGTGIGKTWSIPEKPDESLPFINSDGRLSFRNFDFHLLEFKIGYSF
jgi:hypothetical protein